MNTITLLGRLTKNPEARYTSTGKAVTLFTLAVNRPYANADGQREADFINCQAWGKTAEVVGNHVSKGDRLLVEGRLQIRSYTDKEGVKRYATEVIVNRVEFIERKGCTPGNGSANSAQLSPMDGFATAEFGDEEIPF